MKQAPKLSLAPMAGITDLSFRLICKGLGADIVYSEMISAAGLFYGQNEKSLELAQSIKEESPLAIQLFGSNPEHFAKATKIISDLGQNLPPKTKVNRKSNKEINQIINLRAPEEININFGCPARKVLKEGGGCSLMKKPKLSYEIIKAVINNTNLPVSIKIRAGISTIEAIEFLNEVKDLKWEKVIVHGRTYEEGFSGKIDFEKIKQIKKLFPNKKVVVNGGIFSPEDALEATEKTGVDELAIARGCLGNPWLFKQIKDFAETGEYQKPSLEEIKETVLEHARLFKQYNSPNNLVAFRKHLGWYFKDFPGAKKLREELFRVESLKELKKVLK